MFKLLAMSRSEGKATSKPIGMCSAFSYSSLHMFSFKNVIPITMTKIIIKICPA